MIDKIKVYPYHELLNTYRPPGDLYISVTDGIQNQVAPHKDWNILPLSFPDCGGRDDWHSCSFTDEMGLEIIEFLKANINRPESQTLHVNCMAGKSRSGAIATFACWMNDLKDGPQIDHRQINLEIFKNENPRMVPNIHILVRLVNLYYGVK